MRKDVFIISCITCLITSAGCDETIPDLCTFDSNLPIYQRQYFDGNSCMCVEETHIMNSKGECVCPIELELDKATGKCICPNGGALTDDGCVFCPDYSNWDKNSNSCMCVMDYQEYNQKEQKCVCINGGQTVDEQTGKCKCTRSNQILVDGVCTCLDENEEIDTETKKCKCKNGFTKKDGDSKCIKGNDINKNHMIDSYEAETIDYQGVCKTHADCNSGFCDSFIGYKCSTKCSSDDQCLGESAKDGYNYVCRSDGRCAPDTFISLWNLPKDNLTVTFYFSDLNDVTIDWGDNTEIKHYTMSDVTTLPDDSGNRGLKSISHTYDKAGIKRIKIKGYIIQWGLPIDASEAIGYFSGIEAFGQVGIGGKSFAKAQNNFAISKVDIPDSTLLTSMEWTFYNSAFNQDISHWDVSNVTDMSSVFNGASSFNQDIGHWDTSKVTQMDHMFANASKFNQNIGNWDTSNVTTMYKMFSDATAFNQPLENWDVSKVTNMGGMFSGAKVFNGSLNGWGEKVKKVTSMESMFQNATAFNQPLDQWDVSNVTKMDTMFDKATAFDQDLCNWNVSKVTSFEYMFYMATAFRHSISCWTNKVKTDGANGYLMLTGSGLDDPASDLCKDTTNLNDTLKKVSGFANICKKEKE